MKQVHDDAAASRHTLRVSMDAKATIKLGPFSRGGSSRTGNVASDHDFGAVGPLTPFGLFVPESDELDLYFTHSKVTSDFMVDCLEEWWQRRKERLTSIRELVVDLDNGPENHSRRTQFLHRMVQFAWKYQLWVQLVYYPPYHSKYNAIERCWGILEGHWRGEILDSEAAVLGHARSMTYNGVHPRVHRVQQEYATGVVRTTAQMKHLETLVERTPALEKWFVLIPPPRPDQLIL